MSQLDTLKKSLKEGHVYRRVDFTQWSRSVDRHLQALVEEGTLQKLSQGLYYYPKTGIFGKTPPPEEAVVKGFLNDDRFLITSPNAYNSLGVGTTQLYNTRVVYNHKRHGEFQLGNSHFSFKIKPHFPSSVTQEFLLVDLINNLDILAEDVEEVKSRVSEKAQGMDTKKLKTAVTKYGNVKTRKFFYPIFTNKASA